MVSYSFFFIREIYILYYERKITNFIMLLNIVRSSVLKRHSYLYMTRESEQRFDVSEKITVFLFFFYFKFERRNKICTQTII